MKFMLVRHRRVQTIFYEDNGTRANIQTHNHADADAHGHMCTAHSRTHTHTHTHLLLYFAMNASECGGSIDGDSIDS